QKRDRLQRAHQRHSLSEAMLVCCEHDRLQTYRYPRSTVFRVQNAGAPADRQIGQTARRKVVVMLSDPCEPAALKEQLYRGIFWNTSKNLVLLFYPCPTICTRAWRRVLQKSAEPSRKCKRY